ncbi:phosphate signaling complex protein PhoU [Maricaulis parjimensis]|uniref:phosphate signaling complex protein PhoU n=1 Tax=Maricaulis parjimensis TaxID=144023 RepID=UPI00193A217C|nr:phosphate signaling complex protein PhoU [Maricaulis parjimensis]
MALSKTAHIVTAYGEELDQLNDELARMGGLVETQLTAAINAIVRRDAGVAGEVRQREKQVNAMHVDIEKRVLRLFALRQPLATDLRMTISALKISTDLERVGDLAKNIAYRAKDLSAYPALGLMDRVERLGAIVIQQLHEVLDALSSLDVEPAIRVWRADDEVDERYNALVREMLISMGEDSSLVEPGVHILFVAKNLERIGDHATNIAEALHFMVTAAPLEADTPPAS